MQPTLRTVLLIGAGVPVSLALALAGGELWALAAALPAAMLFALAVDTLMSPGRRHLSVEPDGPGLLYIDDPQVLQLTLRNAGRGTPVVCETLCEFAGPIEPPAAQQTGLRPGTPTVLRVPVHPLRRGEAELHAVWLRWRGPLGLTTKQRRIATDWRTSIVPNIRSVQRLAFRFASRDAPAGTRIQRQQGDGSEFDALRDYVPGLDHRSIDWKHSARHMQLVCKEFRSERNQQIVLAFDTGHLMSEPLAGVLRLDRAINAALQMAYVSLHGGDRVGVFGFDDRVRLFAPPVQGMQNFHRLQHQLARLDYSSQESNFTVGLMDLLGRLNRRTLVVVMTEFVDTVTAELMLHNLERLAARHLVLFVTCRDPDLLRTRDREPQGFRDVSSAVVADGFLRDREVVFERLRRLGVLCLDASHEAIGIGLINQYLQIKQKELL